MKNTQYLVDALVAKYQAQRLEGIANLQIYFDTATGVGEHPDIVAECDKLVTQITDAEGKLEGLQRLVTSTKQE